MNNFSINIFLNYIILNVPGLSCWNLSVSPDSFPPWSPYLFKDRNHKIISIGTEKSLDIVHHHFMIKVIKIGVERIYLNTIKGKYDKLITNVIWKILKHFL